MGPLEKIPGKSVNNKYVRRNSNERLWAARGEIDWLTLNSCIWVKKKCLDFSKNLGKKPVKIPWSGLGPNIMDRKSLCPKISQFLCFANAVSLVSILKNRKTGMTEFKDSLRIGNQSFRVFTYTWDQRHYCSQGCGGPASSGSKRKSNLLISA